MTWKPREFTAELSRALDTYDRERAAELCGQLIQHLRASEDPYDAAEAGRILDVLRRKRHSDLMQRVGDVLIQTGQRGPKIRRQYAQSQLDLGNITAAIATLERLVEDTSAGGAPGSGEADVAVLENENAEARGLLGRAYKQLYVDADAADVTRNRVNLEHAIRQYRDVYAGDPKKRLWHGINSVALIRRAERDGVELEGMEDPRRAAQSMATEILATIEDLEIAGTAQQWDFATAVEACIALERDEEALRWVALYLGSYSTDAFELASTRRQLVEVWQLSPAQSPGDKILPPLEAALLRAAGGALQMPSDAARSVAGKGAPDSGLEKILGDTGLKTLKWFQRGMDCARAVGRVRKQADGRPVGTGFLLRGGDLSPKLDGKMVFLTNAHVVAESGERGAVSPGDAIIEFELAGSGNAQVVPETMVWSSPSHELDYTLLRLSLEQLGLDPLSLAGAKPEVDGKERAYIIGHPQGRDLEISLQDNIILDADDRFVHYRSPTEPGSSGSPVFDEDWKCIGLHHAGKRTMPRLHGEGTYPANEGIWIEAIIRDLGGAPLS